VPFTCARCGHVSRDPDEVREGYCASCGDWSPNAAPAPEPPADLEYQCRGCGARFRVPGSVTGQVSCGCGEQRPCLPAEPRQAEVSVSRVELLGYPVDLVTSPALQPGYIVVGTMDAPGFGWLMAGRSAAELDAGVAALRESLAHPLVPLADWSVTLTGQVTEDQVSLLAGLGAARPDQLPEILAAGRRLEEAVARDGVTWYQRARSAAGALITGALQAIGLPRLPVTADGSGTVADNEHEDWTNPYSWRPGDPEL
jgi:hypothetical protein